MGVHGSKNGARGSVVPGRASQSDFSENNNDNASLSTSGSFTALDAQPTTVASVIPSSTTSCSPSPSPSPRPGSNSLSWSHSSSAVPPLSTASGSSGNIARHHRTGSNNSKGSVRFMRSDSDTEDILSSTFLGDHTNSVATSPRGLTASISSNMSPSVSSNSGSITNRIRRSSSSRRNNSANGIALFSSAAKAASSRADFESDVSDPSPMRATHARTGSGGLIARRGTMQTGLDHEDNSEANSDKARESWSSSRGSGFNFRVRAHGRTESGNEQGSLSGINNVNLGLTRARSNTTAGAPPPNVGTSVTSCSVLACSRSYSSGLTNDSSIRGASGSNASITGSNIARGSFNSGGSNSSSSGSSSNYGNNSSSSTSSNASPSASVVGLSSSTTGPLNSSSGLTRTHTSLSPSRRRSESSIRGFGNSIRRLSRGSPARGSTSHIAIESKFQEPSSPSRPSLHPSESPPPLPREMSKSPPRRRSQVSTFSHRFRFRSRSGSRTRGVSPSTRQPKDYNTNRMPLPNEVVFHICGFVGIRGLGRLASTCRMFAQEDLLWRAMALVTYGSLCHLNPYVGSWRSLCIDDNRKNEPFAPPPLSEDQVAMLAFGGEDPPDPRYLHESEPLLDVLFDASNNWEMLKVLCSIQDEGAAPRKVSKILAGALALLAEDRGVGAAMCCALVTVRLDALAQPESFEPIARAFQAVSLAVDVVVSCLRIRCARFLHAVLGRPINEAMNVDNLEVDPQRTKAPGDEAENLPHLVNAVSNILRTIMERIDEVPHDVRMLLAHVQNEVIRVSEGKLAEGASLFAGQIFFLKCIVPALITPLRFGLCAAPPSPWQLRNLVLVAKVIQTISTGALFSTREPFMIPCNEFIKSIMPSVRTFCETLLTPRYTPDLGKKSVGFSEAHLATAQHRLLRVITDAPFRRPLETQLRSTYPHLPALLDGSRWDFSKLWSALSSSSGD